MIVVIAYGIKIIIFIVALCFVQYYLAKKKNKYLGLIIPIIIFIFSIILCVSFSSIWKDKYIITTNSGKEYTYQTENEVKAKVAEIEKVEMGFDVKLVHYPRKELSTIVFYFISINICTIVLIIIYANARKKTKDNINMYIDDL